MDSNCNLKSLDLFLFERSRMWRILENILRDWKVARYRRRVERALGLHLRGEVRRDGLKLKKIQNRLEIEWQARDVHPWDRDLPPERRLPLFVDQLLADTEQAISRLFNALPAVDAIDLKVIPPASDIAIIEGTVSRATLNRNRNSLSVKMRLLELGVRCRWVGLGCESTAPNYDPDSLSMATPSGG